MKLVIKVQLVDEKGEALYEDAVACEPKAEIGHIIPVFSQMFRSMKLIYLKGMKSMH